MPNWCNNILTLRGDGIPSRILGEVLKPFLDNAGNLDFGAVIPLPKNLDKTEEVNWQTTHWGTKWNAQGFCLDGDTCLFQTAWSPPIPVVKELSHLTGRQFRLVYEERGIGFCGEVLTPSPFFVGTLIHNEYSIPKAPLSLLSELFGEEDGTVFQEVARHLEGELDVCRAKVRTLQEKQESLSGVIQQITALLRSSENG